MSYSVEQLRQASDAELIRQHDEAARNTGILGVNYFLDELRRREQARAIAASQRLALASFVLMVVNAIVAIVAVVIAVTLS